MAHQPSFTSTVLCHLMIALER